MKRTCVQCGKQFEISEAEIGYYEQQKLAIPTSCYACRRSDRLRRTLPVVPKGVGRFGRNRFGIGHAMPGMFSILLLAAFFMLGRSSFTGGDIGSRQPGTVVTQPGAASKTYIFKDFDQLVQQFETYGKEMGYDSEEEYLAAANEVIADPRSIHSRKDGKEYYERSQTGEQVILSAEGYIITFCRQNR